MTLEEASQIYSELSGPSLDALRIRCRDQLSRWPKYAQAMLVLALAGKVKYAEVARLNSALGFIG
jgi:hypothetical protein